MTQRRYPGAKPFTREQAPIFHGRDADIEKLHQLVSLEPLVVLYGKSGLGKSSLLNAGLLPRLEQDPHNQALTLRFNAWTETTRHTPLDKVVEELTALPHDRSLLDRLGAKDDSLWSHAKAYQLARPAGRPLLIFDQFEELFSYPAEQIVAFKQQLAELLRDQLPDRYEPLLDKASEANTISPAEESQLDRPLGWRMLFSIRSDRMHLLDQLSDYLPQVLKNNHELLALVESDARRALVEPAAMAGAGFATPPFSYSATAQEHIIDFLRDADNGRVEAIQLQILGTSFEDRAAAENIREFGAAEVGDLQGIIDNYYHTQLSRIPQADQRAAAAKLLEEGLVDQSRQQRLTLHESQIATLYSVDSALLDQLVNSNLLRREPDRRQGYTYELSHDTLIAPALAAREKREAEEAKALAEWQAAELATERKKRRRLLWLSVLMGVLALASISGGIIAYSQSQKAKLAQEEAEDAKAEAIASLERATKAESDAIDAREKAEKDRDKAAQAEKIAEQEKNRATAALSLADAQRRLAEAEAAKGRLLEETLASEDAFEYLVAEGHRQFGAGEFQNALTYWANARFVEPQGEQIGELVEAAQMAVAADDNFLNGEFMLADSVFTAVWLKKDLLDVEIIRMLQVNLWKSKSAWDEAVAGRDLSEIDSLILNSNGYTLAIPKSLGLLQNLTYLRISGIRGLNRIPENLGALQNLQLLEILWNDQLTSLPKSIGQLQNLQQLTISHNRLTSLPGSIGQLQNLQQLTISYNDKLTSLPGSIGQLQNLQQLTIYDNEQLTSLPESLGRLKSLKKLILWSEFGDGGNISTLPKSLLELKDSLEELDLRSNPIPEEEVNFWKANLPSTKVYSNFDE